MLNSILFVLGSSLSLFGSFIIFCATIGFVRNEDFFIKVQAVSVSLLYGASFLLLGETLRNFDAKAFLMTLIVILLNIVASLVVLHAITRYAFMENVKHNAKDRREMKED